MLLSAVAPLPAVSKRLGHATSDITAVIYPHALPKDEERVVEAWERGIAGAQPGRRDGGVQYRWCSP
jgi:integrase